jgi:hypothetical protein
MVAYACGCMIEASHLFEKQLSLLNQAAISSHERQMWRYLSSSSCGHSASELSPTMGANLRQLYTFASSPVFQTSRTSQRQDMAQSHSLQNIRQVDLESDEYRSPEPRDTILQQKEHLIQRKPVSVQSVREPKTTVTIQSLGNVWKPGLWTQFPYVAVLPLLGCVVCLAGSVAILSKNHSPSSASS